MAREEQPEFVRRRTKIISTIGPSSDTPEILEQLILTGMNIARLNLAHGTYEGHARSIRILHELSRKTERNIAILIDIPGPKYRVGSLAGGKVRLEKGSRVVLTTRTIKGDSTRIPVNLPTFPEDVHVGDTVLLDDGAVEMEVLTIEDPEVRCVVTVGGALTENRGIAVPGMHISGPFITEALREHIRFATGQHPDFLALSFVSHADDVTSVRKILTEMRADVPIIAKIERGEALRNFNGIMQESDGIMVARGDLGVDIPLERVPLAQKEIIRTCNRAGKPVITATEMLESMVRSARPTRAEVTDVANAIFDGTDATMLSEETAIGKYPVETVRMMARIARETEQKLPYDRILAERGKWVDREISDMISYNACLTAQNLHAAAIIAFTRSGSTAGRVSKYRPGVPILAITPDPAVATRLLLRWGVHPYLAEGPLSVEELFLSGADLSRNLGLAEPHDIIVITAGIPLGEVGSTNLLKVQRVD
jgi:pyruvate kinase